MKNLSGGLLLTLILAGGISFTAPAQAENIEIGSRELANLGISLIKPQRTDRANTINALANVVLPPHADVAVAALQSGLIVRLHVGAGDTVSQGQAMADIMSKEFLILQSEFLDALGNRVLTETARIRDEQLHTDGIISQRRLSETRTRAAEADLHLAEQRQLLILSGLSAAELQQLEKTRQFFESLTVRSPMRGEVLQRWVGAGDQVNPGARLFRVGDLEQLWLEIQLPADALQGIAPGYAVSRNIPGTEQELARITTSTRVVDSDSQKVMVRAETTNAGHRLLPGQRIEVTIHIPGPSARETTTWEVPARAITHHGAEAYLFARNDTGFDVVPVVLHGGQGELVFVEAVIDDRTEIALTGVATLKAIWLSAEG